MRIPFRYLAEHLENVEIIGEIPILFPDTPMVRPRFLLPGARPEPGRLYVAPSGTAAVSLPASTVILTSGTPELLLNQLQDLYDQFEAWDASLAAAADTGEMRELLDEIETILGNPVILRKSSYAIVACSGEVFSDPDLAFLRGTHVPFEYVNALKRDPQFDQMQTAKTPFFFQYPNYKTPAMGINLFFQEDASYRLTILPTHHPIAQQDQFLLNLCAGYVSQVLQNTVIAGRQADPSGRRERLVALFRTSVENESADPIVLEQAFSALGWQASHQYCCLAVRIGTPDYLSHTVELLCKQLESQLPAACVFEHHAAIAVLVNTTLAGSEIRALLDRCVYFFRDNDLRAGISNPFSAFRELRNYYKQALIALDFASRPQSFLWIRYFSDVVLDYILEQSNRELPLHLICSRRILEIRQHDQDHQTDFYDTLEAYIQNRFNAVQTAKELGIHRSTFLYRMERLQTLFDLDLNQRDSLLYALLSMKMLELSKSMSLHE